MGARENRRRIRELRSGRTAFERSAGDSVAAGRSPTSLRPLREPLQSEPPSAAGTAQSFLPRRAQKLRGVSFASSLPPGPRRLGARLNVPGGLRRLQVHLETRWWGLSGED